MYDKPQQLLRAYLDRSIKQEPYIRLLPCVTVHTEARVEFRPRTLTEARELLGPKWALSPEREPKIRRKTQ